MFELQFRERETEEILTAEVQYLLTSHKSTMASDALPRPTNLNMNELSAMMA